MTYPGDDGQPPQYPQQGYGQQYPQDEPWPPQQYDPFAHQQHIGAQQQGTAGQQYPGQQPYGQPWPPQDQQYPPHAPPWQQQPHMPPQPPQKRKSWPARHKVLTGLIAFGTLVVIGAAASAANKPSTPTANTAADKPSTPTANTAAASSPASPSAAPSSPSAAARPDCATQAKAWIANRQLTTFGNDVGAFGATFRILASNPVGTAAARDTAAVQSEAASIESDAQALEANPEPSCIPGLRGDINAGAKDYSTAAIDTTNALNQFSAGNVDTATADMQSAEAAMSRGTIKIAAASTDVSKFGASLGG